MAPYLRRCDIYIIVFAVNNVQSYRNALDIWLPECEKHATPDSKIMLLGTKIDCERTTPPKSMIQDGLNPLYAYAECSVRNDIGIGLCKQLLFQALLERHSSIKAEEEYPIEKEIISPP